VYRSAAKRYGFALLAPVAAAILCARTLSLSPGLFYVAVVSSAWYGGARPAWLAGFAAAAGQALVAQALGASAWVQGALLIGVAVIVGGLSDALSEARRRAASALALASDRARALELEERRTETVLQSISDGIGIQDASGTFVFLNDAGASMLGCDAGEELVGKTAADVFTRIEPLDEMDRPIPPEALPGARALAGEATPERMIRYRLEDSEADRWAVVRSRPVRDEAGKVILAVSAVHDLTERIRHEKALESNARDLHQLTGRLEVMVEQLRLEQEGALLARAEAEGALERIVTLQRITAALSEARTPDQVADVVLEQGMDAIGARSGLLLGFASAGDAIEVIRAAGVLDPRLLEWVRESTSDVVHLKNVLRRDEHGASDLTLPSEDRVSPDALRLALGTDSLVMVPLTARDRPLGVLVFDVQGRPPLDPGDRDLLIALGRQGAQALDRARLLLAERIARDEAEHANRAKSQFLAVMSHELRTPLNAILGYEELLETEVSGPISAVQKQHLARIRESTRSLLALIEQILSLSRVQSGEEDVRLEEIDATTLAREVASAVEPHLLRKGIMLDLQLPPDGSLGLQTDPRKVRQILFNVLSNAAKFTDQGTVRVTLSMAGDALLYTVKDTGPGIEERDREHIFEPFVQVWGDGTPPTGTGLGLPVARELARHLGGDITVESQIGEGSSFTIRLPHRARLPSPAEALGVSRSLQQ
jgi:PAS domain S-box-containing protein